jgi:hypothetical protein
MSVQESRLVAPVLAAALGLAWILAGMLVAGVTGLTDEPEAPTWAVLIAAWLPVPMTLALVADVWLREFGTTRRDGTVPRAVIAALALWAICAVVALTA